MWNDTEPRDRDVVGRVRRWAERPPEIGPEEARRRVLGRLDGRRPGSAHWAAAVAAALLLTVALAVGDRWPSRRANRSPGMAAPGEGAPADGPPPSRAVSEATGAPPDRPTTIVVPLPSGTTLYIAG